MLSNSEEGPRFSNLELSCKIKSIFEIKSLLFIMTTPEPLSGLVTWIFSLHPRDLIAWMHSFKRVMEVAVPRKKWIDLAREDMERVGTKKGDEVDRDKWKILSRCGDPE